jgi:hypothetical protein
MKGAIFTIWATTAFIAYQLIKEGYPGWAVVGVIFFAAVANCDVAGKLTKNKEDATDE